MKSAERSQRQYFSEHANGRRTTSIATPRCSSGLSIPNSYLQELELWV